MKQRSLFVFCIIFGMAGFADAQTKSLTNSDLETYRQERLKAEREYRENYAKLGFPSPEELDRQREQNRIETEQLSAKLRAERLDRERIEAQRETNAQRAATYFRYVSVEPQNIAPVYFWSYGHRFRFPVRQTYYQQPGYFAGGHFWPTGPRTRPQPMWVVRRR